MTDGPQSTPPFSTTLTDVTATPAAQGQIGSVARLADVRIGTYVTLSGNIVGNERRDIYTFRDDIGQISAEIEREIWRSQKAEPTANVQIFGELDRGVRGRYISVEWITVVE